MSAPEPHFRVQGDGVAVVCLHSNASSSSQWRALSDRLSARHRVIAVDAYGAGRSPEWPHDGPLRLADEARLVQAALPAGEAPFHLVGHSYGAAAALTLATLQPQRVRSLVVYEPTLFHLVAGSDPAASPARGIWHASQAAEAAIDRGDAAAAAGHFIDFWMGPGSWAAMPATRQPAVATSMRHIRRWRQTLFAETTPLAAFATLAVPVLLMWGDRSPDSALAVVEVLKNALPTVTEAPQRGLGHMGPITHPDPINAQIAAFLARH